MNQRGDVMKAEITKLLDSIGKLEVNTECGPIGVRHNGDFQELCSLVGGPELIKEYCALIEPEISNADFEGAHSNADRHLCDLLTRLGFGEVVAVYEQVTQYYA